MWFNVPFASHNRGRRVSSGGHSFVKVRGGVGCISVSPAVLSLSSRVSSLQKSGVKSPAGWNVSGSLTERGAATMPASGSLRMGLGFDDRTI